VIVRTNYDSYTKSEFLLKVVVFPVRQEQILTYFIVSKETCSLSLPLHFPILVYFNYLTDYHEIWC
jgi:hypothetical protein